MSYSSKSTGAKLYIGASVSDPPVAPGSDTFSQVLQCSLIGEPAIAQTPSSFYILESTAPQSNGSNIADRDWPFKIYWDKAMTPHTTLKSDAKIGGGRKRNVRVDMPDGIRHDFVGFVTNFKLEDIEATGDAVSPRAFDLTIRQTGDDTESTVP